MQKITNKILSIALLLTLVVPISLVPTIVSAHTVGSTISLTGVALSATSIKLTWTSTSTSSSSLAQHDLYIWRCLGANCTPDTNGTPVFQQISNFLPIWPTGSFTDTGLNSGSTYRYTVREHHGGSATSGTTATTGNIILPPPVDNAPTISITPATQTIEATGPSGATAIYSVLANDDVDGNISGSASCSPLSGSMFAIANTTINCSVTDSGAHTVSTSATVTVQDTTAPVITLTGSATISLNTGDTYTEQGATATDIVDGSVSVTVGGASVNTATPGIYTVTYNAVDSHGNNAVQITRTVTVSDNNAPVIDTQANQTLEATSPSGAALNYGPITATDDVDGTISATCTPVSGSTFALGTTPINCTATDSNSNVGNGVAFTVTVQDTTPPTITLTGSNSVNLTVGDTYTEAGATATDIVDGSVSVTVLGSVDTNTSGTYTVTYDAVDAHGNHAVQITRTVIVSAQTITPPPANNGGGNGGGGNGGNNNDDGGNGPIAGSLGGLVLGASIGPSGQVLGESCGLYMEKHLRLGSKKNDTEQVKKLQEFLNKEMNAGLPVTGYFGNASYNAVKAFQNKYADEVLSPWGETKPTGLVYLTTLRKINNQECPEAMAQMPKLVPWSQNPDAQ